jgi:hypothetical protein
LAVIENISTALISLNVTVNCSDLVMHNYPNHQC